MISIKILPMVLKNSLAHQIMMKEEEKNHNLQEKNKKVFRLIKDKRGGKIITKFSTIAPKTYGYSVQKDYHEIEDSEFIKAKGVKKSACKDLTFHDFDVFTM